MDNKGFRRRVDTAWQWNNQNQQANFPQLLTGTLVIETFVKVTNLLKNSSKCHV